MSKKIDKRRKYTVNNNHKTSINVMSFTAIALKDIKINSLETYDEIIVRLLKFYKENKSGFIDL